MVEVALNVMWLVIAFAITAAFLPRHRGRIAAVVAVACLIVLLFPIVSISDDLSPARDAVEECGGVRRSLLAAAHCPLSIAHHSSAALAAANDSSLAVALVEIGPAVAAADAARSFVLVSRASPRSPPAA